MYELIDINPDVNVEEAEYIRLLGYPRGHSLEGRPKELAQWAREWFRQNGQPWVYARKVDRFEIDGDGILIDGVRCSSTTLRERLTAGRARGAFIAAVSAGVECEELAHRLWLEEKPDEYFFLEAYGSAVVEHLIASTGFRFCEWADREKLGILPHYSPGYPGWDISEQHALLSAIQGDRGTVFPGKLEVLETGMLKPKKSLLAVFGITPEPDKAGLTKNLIPCENCSLSNCQFRRMPYRRTLPQTESVGALQHRGLAGSNADSMKPVLTPNAKYSLSAHALRKWTEERLTLSVLADGSVEAHFNYEGTTCSNLGRPLYFHYYVRLGPPEDNYRVERAQCLPSPTDDGHKYMCEYLDKGDPFVSSIISEQPLLGEPLEEVLMWERRHSPSGCFCEPESRQHKWGLVFEVIHYALSRERNGEPIQLKRERAS